MVNSPTMCQRFIDLILQPLQQQFPDAYTYHYMEDILLAHFSPQKLTEILSSLQIYLNSQGLIIAPEKIQCMSPWKYFGFQILQKTITPLQFSFKVPEPLTSYSLQQFLGHLNWIRPSLGISTYAVFPFFFNYYREMKTLFHPAVFLLNIMLYYNSALLVLNIFLTGVFLHILFHGFFFLQNILLQQYLLKSYLKR